MLYYDILPEKTLFRHVSLTDRSCGMSIFTIVMGRSEIIGVLFLFFASTVLGLSLPHPGIDSDRSTHARKLTELVLECLLL